VEIESTSVEVHRTSKALLT